MYCNYSFTKILAITCSADDVANGMVIYSSDTTPPYDYGTTATYECDTGYEQTGGDRERSCTGDGIIQSGDWNGITAICSRKNIDIITLCKY